MRHGCHCDPSNPCKQKTSKKRKQTKQNKNKKTSEMTLGCRRKIQNRKRSSLGSRKAFYKFKILLLLEKGMKKKTASAHFQRLFLKQRLEHHTVSPQGRRWLRLFQGNMTRQHPEKWGLRGDWPCSVPHGHRVGDVIDSS